MKAFAVPGIKCYVPSSDHDPRHFEAHRRGAWVVRIFILRPTGRRGLNREYKMQMRGRQRTPEEQDIWFDLVMKKKRQLLREWNAKACPDRRW
ncbi:MAG TPA: hypothetical protein VF142_20570 [Longimicrobium sp.]